MLVGGVVVEKIHGTTGGMVVVVCEFGRAVVTSMHELCYDRQKSSLY